MSRIDNFLSSNELEDKLVTSRPFNYVNEQIVKKLASKYGLSPEEVRLAVQSQFRCVSEAIRSAAKGDVESHLSIRLPSLGRFLPIEKRITRNYEEDV